MKKLIKTGIIIGIITTELLSAFPTNLTHKDNTLKYLESYIFLLKKEPLSKQEKEMLLYLYEKEKLARDMYYNFYLKYNLPIFYKISKMKNNNIEEILTLLNKYNIMHKENNTIGVFNNKKIQNLYKKLMKKGNKNIKEALKVCIGVENENINEINKDLKIINNKDIKIVLDIIKEENQNNIKILKQILKKYNKN